MHEDKDVHEEPKALKPKDLQTLKPLAQGAVACLGKVYSLGVYESEALGFGM